MAIKDIKSNLLVTSALVAAVGSNTTTTGAIIDTEDFELGLMFDVSANAYTDGTYVFSLLESTDSAMAGATEIPADKLIGSFPDITAATAQGDNIATVGAFSNKRYVQLQVVSTAVTTGATFDCRCTQKAEVMPVA